MIREIEIGIQVGPYSAGHTRDVYAGCGVEIWHETIVPWNPLRLMLDGITEKAYLFPGSLPRRKPKGATFCGMQDAYYSDGKIAMIIWEGKFALDQATAWAKANEAASKIAA